MDIDWWEYEARKKELLDNLTPKEYEAEITKIVEQLENEVIKNE